jgi:hypothetical protein
VAGRTRNVITIHIQRERERERARVCLTTSMTNPIPLSHYACVRNITERVRRE